MYLSYFPRKITRADAQRYLRLRPSPSLCPSIWQAEAEANQPSSFPALPGDDQEHPL